MSRTFEVLERVQQDQELFRVPPVTKKVPPKGRPSSSTASIPDLDACACEEVLKLVQYLFLATDGNGRHGPRRLVFCGIDESHGSNQLCARVGRSLAEQVRSQVCLVDANLRMPASRPLVDLPPSDASPQSEHGTTKKLRQVTDNLWLASSESVITSGGAPTLDQLQGLIKGLGDEFTYLIVCAPPIGLYSDAVLLGQTADGVVLVLEANSTRRVAARKAKHDLEAANVRILGMVLNNRTFPIPEKIYRKL